MDVTVGCRLLEELLQKEKEYQQVLKATLQQRAHDLELVRLTPTIVRLITLNLSDSLPRTVQLITWNWLDSLPRIVRLVTWNWSSFPSSVMVFSKVKTPRKRMFFSRKEFIHVNILQYSVAGIVIAAREVARVESSTQKKVTSSNRGENGAFLLVSCL